jgi:SOS-response transcriptional repressor LexA
METVFVEPFASIRIPAICLVGASRSIEHLPIREWRDIRPIKNARPFDRFCAARVSGNSLYDDGIFDGDYIIAKLTFELSEITPGHLVVILTPCGLLLKHIYQMLDGRIRLVSANPVYADIVFDAADVEIQGVVVRVERDF